MHSEFYGGFMCTQNLNILIITAYQEGQAIETDYHIVGSFKRVLNFI